MPSYVVVFILLMFIPIASLILYMHQAPVEPPFQAFLSSRVKIEAVSVEGNNVNLFVRNVGRNPVEISISCIVNGTSGLVIACNVSRLSIEGGELIIINIELKMLLSPGVYIAKVATSRGYEASYIFAILSRTENILFCTVSYATKYLFLRG